MSQPPLNYAIRQTGGQLGGNLGWLFTMLWLHCDQSLRCHPGDDLLMIETGIKSSATMQKHRDELVKRKAIVLVPVALRRSEKEKKLSKRKYVYQLTGVMELPSGELVPTVCFTTPQSVDFHVEILTELDFDIALIFKALTQENALISKGINPLEIESFKNQSQSSTDSTTSNTDSSNPKDSTRIAREQDNPIAELSVVEEPAVVEVQPDSDSQKLDIVGEAEKHLDDVGANLPKPKNSAKGKKPRERDRLFDGIAFVCFGLDAKSTDPDVKAYLDEEGSRIGAIKKYLLGLKNKGTPEEIWEWGKWYEREHPGNAKPRVLVKFKEHWLKFRQQKADGSLSTKPSDGTRFDNFSAPKPEDYAIPEGVEYL
jgi:hypothetical protein